MSELWGLVVATGGRFEEPLVPIARPRFERQLGAADQRRAAGARWRKYRLRNTREPHERVRAESR